MGDRVAASSPQGRFAAGAAELDGLTMTDAMAVGKQLFLEFAADEDAPRLWLRVHLGIYGAWDFGFPDRPPPDDPPPDLPLPEERAVGTRLEGGTPASADHEDSVHSIGAPRRARIRMAESETELGSASFPADPVGQVRLRLLADSAVADLRGPTACEVLQPEQVAAVIARLGPDPLVDDGLAAEERFTEVVRRKPTPIGLLLMDQSVVAGIGNVYRAELLYRARLNPHTPGKLVPEDVVRALWEDWSVLLRRGVETGLMLTMDGLSDETQAKAIANRDDRHWVYRRAGLPCRTCGTDIVLEVAAARKLYWCPQCQA